MSRGAVVPLQPDDERAGKIVLEAQDVVHLCAAPAVDRLVVVTHAADIGIALRQQPQPQILGDVGVLILIHQHVAEAALEILQHIRLGLEQGDAVEQQVAEIRRIEHGQPVLILLVKLAPLAIAEGARLAFRNVLRRQATVLPAVHLRGEHARRPALLIQPLGLDHLFHQAQLIVSVENGEAALQAHQLRMAAQDLHADGVERAEPRHALDALAHVTGDTLLHLARRLVGEGHRKDLRGIGPAACQNMRDAGGQNPRFAGASPCQHQNRPVGAFHCQPLFRIEPFEIFRRPALLASPLPRRQSPRRNAAALRLVGRNRRRSRPKPGIILSVNIAPVVGKTGGHSHSSSQGSGAFHGEQYSNNRGKSEALRGI